MSEFLKIEKLQVKFGKDTVIDDLNLTIPENAITVFLGPSGSGKTTVLRSISGLNQNATGKILLDGQDISQLPVNKRNIGVIFQSYALFPNMTVFDNVAYGLRAKKVAKKEIIQRVKEMLSLVDLDKKANSYPDDLSGGQKQRVAIARSMIMKPKLLLLDEPLSALDAKIRVELRNQIRKYQQKLGITMIFVTHDQSEAMAIADNVVVISDGKIQQQGSPDEIYKKPSNEFMATFIGEHNLFSKEQLEQLGMKDLATDKKYLIRPEAIQLSDDASDNLKCQGEIVEVVNLGNRVQYVFSVNDIELKIEALNQNKPFEKGMKTTVYINKQDIYQVEP
ncbi:ABC transporter ATP-binding protein [Companilactobacillus halodurans]|uniref:ABC-type quaternary amine transporter n=1 Tax=Companilactobacillus halodurans TaxID=2584183 RepID=A0A5P0ZRX4_9LACO|nr:ABC transporter ATP-binding protein [Companilactobacillus halodurans]MQS76641.1 ABC transporter ATP-binding protein [Companilactobacillus halodurans]MQS97798.1 ABC transporter ATP-binding protein [Companilactobacillus halodurans]